MAYKYPFIPDKRMYAAVMGACSYIRDTGYFNKAISYYAHKYGVNESELEKHVRARQGAGQKAANKSKPKRVYKWFAVEYSMGNERNGACYFEPLEAQYCVARGIRADTVKDRLSKHDDYMSEYSPVHWFGRVEECETEEAAYQRISEWKSQNVLECPST